MRGVVHFEIPADDQERARNFYTEAFGWKIDPMPELNYNVISTTPSDQSGRPNEPGAINGGLMGREGDLKTPVITVDVADIDATLRTVEQLGGSVVMPKDTVPGMGFFAYFKDTEGNIMGLWENLPAAQAGAEGDVEGAAG